jgi:hypothetical protein
VGLTESIYLGGVLIAFGCFTLAVIYAQITTWLPARKTRKD